MAERDEEGRGLFFGGGDEREVEDKEESSTDTEGASKDDLEVAEVDEGVGVEADEVLEGVALWFFNASAAILAAVSSSGNAKSTKGHSKVSPCFCKF